MGNTYFPVGSLAVKVKGVTPASSPCFWDPCVLPLETQHPVKGTDLQRTVPPGGWCLILAGSRLRNGASVVPSVGHSSSLRLAGSG